MSAPICLTRGRLLSNILRYSLDCAGKRTGLKCMSWSGMKRDVHSTADSGKAKEISLAMKAYLEKATAHDEYMKGEVQEYEIGKRHLANIMSLDPDSITQDDIDRAIEYLLPSGLYDKKARPQMKHPVDVLPPRKAAQFGVDGRPFHHLFYTGKPRFYHIMQEMGEKLDQLKRHSDQMSVAGVTPDADRKLLLAGSRWISKVDFEKIMQEDISQSQYDQFVRLMARVAEEPFAYQIKDEIFKYRFHLQSSSALVEVLPLKYTETGRPYMTGEGKRKTCIANVTVWGKGTGSFTVNNTNILTAFPCILDRQQLLFPLQLAGVLGEVDVSAAVTAPEQGAGRSAQAGAVRLATARALASFVDRDMLEKMRLAGLLTNDPRRRERKKYGQEGARRKFTWKKR